MIFYELHMIQWLSIKTHVWATAIHEKVTKCGKQWTNLTICLQVFFK